LNNKKTCLSLNKQCQLLDVSRSTFYCQPQPESEYNLMLMRLLDEIHLEYPFYGSRRLKGALMDKGYMDYPHLSRRLLPSKNFLS